MTGLQCWENQAWGGDQSSLWDHPSRKDRTFSVEMQLAWFPDVFCLPHLAASCRESRPSCISCCCRTTHPSIRCLKARGPFSLAVTMAQGGRGPLLHLPGAGMGPGGLGAGSAGIRSPARRLWLRRCQPALPYSMEAGAQGRGTQRIRQNRVVFDDLRSHVVSLPTTSQGNHKFSSSSKQEDTDPTTRWKGCQSHTVRPAGGRRYIVAAIFGKYHLSQQGN